MTENKLKVRDVLKTLINYNLDAEFQIIGNDGYPINITELNIGYSVYDGAECEESKRDFYIERMTCDRVTLYPNASGMERVE